MSRSFYARVRPGSTGTHLRTSHAYVRRPPPDSSRPRRFRLWRGGLVGRLLVVPGGGEGWWSCPLDVEDLASSAVDMICAATEVLLTSRGGRGQVTTSPALIVASFAAPEH